MASTAAMFTGLSGLAVNARRLEVIGNNISNVNTTAFKSNRMMFAPLFSRNFGLGTGPNGVTGGTNPGQIGLGAAVSGTQRNFNTGGVTSTGIPTDIAIEGAGFFIVEEANSQYFTRDGAFRFNANNELTTVGGARLQGYGVDDNFNIVEGVLTNIAIPLGVATIAEATENVEFSGNLNADGDVATTGTVLDFARLQDGGGTDIAIGGSILAIEGAGGPVFTPGDTITISGAERGGKVIPDATFTVGAPPAGDGTSMQELVDWMQDVLGVVPDGGYNPADPLQPGVEPGSASMTGGVLTFIGNWGEMNELTLAADNFIVNTASGEANPFIPTVTQPATGESVRTTFTVYDTLGSPLNVDLTMVLAREDTDGTYWRAFLHSDDDTDIRLHLETGANEQVPYLQFDNFGKLVTDLAISVELDRLDTGAQDPLMFNLNFESDGGRVTALSSPDGPAGVSTLASTFQDGSPLGVLTNFAVGIDGTLTGGFSNGLTRTIGQLVLANFTNAEGLVDTGGGLYRSGPNSGSPLVAEPLEFGTGRTLGGSLELSNVDLSTEFTNMILTSTGYSAASRVITTSDQLLQQLLLIGR